MTLVLETGAGVRDANSYVTAAFVTTYLTARGRETENSWSTRRTDEKDEFCIAATDHVEQRFGYKFKGAREFSFDQVLATGSVVFAGVPLTTETMTLGDVTYTFVAALSGSANEIMIGADAASTASNLYDAISDNSDNEGSTYGTGTAQSRHATAELASATVTLTAIADGAAGNDTVLSGSPTNVTLTAFSGGLDGGEQPLSFPRRYLYDSLGNVVVGIPRRLKEAVAEYTARATGGTKVLATGSIVFSDVPIDTETMTLGDITYTFAAALSGAANEVLIGADAAGTASNLYDAITDNSVNEGATYGTGTAENDATTAELDTVTITLTATADGAAGNATVLSGSPTNVTLTAFSGGSVTAGAKLAPDPTGIGVVREKVGPIEVEYSSTSYSGIVITAYPEADRWLRPYLATSSGVIR